jgi:hypothetical protein
LELPATPIDAVKCPLNVGFTAFLYLSEEVPVDWGTLRNAPYERAGFQA